MQKIHSLVSLRLTVLLMLLLGKRRRSLILSLLCSERSLSIMIVLLWMRSIKVLFSGFIRLDFLLRSSWSYQLRSQSFLLWIFDTFSFNRWQLISSTIHVGKSTWSVNLMTELTSSFWGFFEFISYTWCDYDIHHPSSSWKETQIYQRDV